MAASDPASGRILTEMMQPYGLSFAIRESPVDLAQSQNGVIQSIRHDAKVLSSAVDRGRYRRMGGACAYRFEQINLHTPATQAQLATTRRSYTEHVSNTIESCRETVRTQSRLVAAMRSS